MSKVEIAVIPCAGEGTRMRPATRVIPKPLLAVVDTPAVQYVVEEAVAAGVTEVVFVVDHRPGDPVLSHFTIEPPLPGLEHVSFRSVEQTPAAGLGDAVLQAREAVGDRPFLCLLSDRFEVPGGTISRRVIGTFDGRLTVAVERVDAAEGDRAGFIIPEGGETGGVVGFTGAVEKPGVGNAPSNLALLGRYVFPPTVFAALADAEPGYGGEIQLTDAIDALARAGGGTAVIADHTLLDVGNSEGMVEATAAIARARAEAGA